MAEPQQLHLENELRLRCTLTLALCGLLHRGLRLVLLPIGTSQLRLQRLARVLYRCLSQRWQRGGNASNSCTVLSLLGARCAFMGSLAHGHVAE